MGNERLYDTFARLCEVRSPTGEEREVADTLAAELRALGLEVEEDDAEGPAEAGAGNLLARVPGERDEFVMFCAHIDTVPHKGRVEVVNDEGVFRSAGETILGADNKAAVAVFMEMVGAGDRADAAGRDRAAAHRRRGAGSARRQGLRHGEAARPRSATCSTTPGRSAR